MPDFNEQFIIPPALDFINLMPMVDMLQKEKETLLAQQEIILKENAELKAHITSLKEQVDYLKRMLYGQKTERVIADDSQPVLPGMEEAVTGEKTEPEKTHRVKEHECRDKAPGQPKAGWNDFPADLPREEKIIDLPESLKADLVFKGYATSQRLVYRGGYVVIVVKRAQYGRPEGAQYGVLTAPPLPVPSCLSQSSDRCHYDASVFVHVIALKLEAAIPFYRQELMFAKMKIQFGRSVMCEAFSRISNALQPLYDRMAELVMQCEIIHADETHVDMLAPGSGKTRCCWIWVRKTGLGPPMTVFHFALDRSKTTALEILGEYRGTILRDGYAAYESLPAEAAGCWAHCRRKFFDARENYPELSAKALALIRLLYDYEAQARAQAEQRMGETALFKERKIYRRLSAPYVDRYFALCNRIMAEEPPSSQIAKAAAYSAAREKELRKFLDNPKLNIDNNPCENVIRPFCLGRKNWLFVGNRNGGTSMAVLASFAATCKDNGIDFEKWLAEVIVKLDFVKKEDIDELLPIRRKAEDK